MVCINIKAASEPASTCSFIRAFEQFGGISMVIESQRGTQYIIYDPFLDKHKDSFCNGLSKTWQKAQELTTSGQPLINIWNNMHACGSPDG